MELKHIQWENSPDGAWVNGKDFNPSIHKLWVEPVPEIIEAVEAVEIIEAAEIAKPQQAIAPVPSRKSHKKGGS